MMLIRPIQMCWICGKAVTPENYQAHEHGSAVHARCQAVRIALANASAKLSHRQRGCPLAADLRHRYYRLAWKTIRGRLELFVAIPVPEPGWELLRQPQTRVCRSGMRGITD